MSEVMRSELGSYMSIQCFRFLRFGAEETAGRGLIVAAGKERGHSLNDLLKGVKADDDAAITAALSKILGIDGTRLCLVQSVKNTPQGYEVKITESACSFGIKADEPNCAYTLGVFIGAMEVISGRRLTGQETECAATGGEFCTYILEFLG